METDAPRDVEVIGYLNKSIQKYHPGSKLTVITNKPDAFAEKYQDLTLVERIINSEELMYERTKAYAEYVATNADGHLIAFLDADCLLIDALDDLAALDFDMALSCLKSGYGRPATLDDLGMLTFGNASPINGGVVFSRSTPAAIKTWELIVETYDQLAAMGEGFFIGREHLLLSDDLSSIKKWGGDQFALMSVFGRYLIPDFPDQATVNDARVLFLDAQVFNATPKVVEKGIRFDSAIRPKIIHMKGTKKKKFIPLIAKRFGVT